MDDNLVESLREIGLTEYQSRSYIAVVTLGTAELTHLAEEAEVPVQRIYDVVDDLQQVGLVEVHEGSDAKQAVAVPPKSGLTALKRQRVAQFESTFETATDTLSERFAEVTTSAGFVTSLTHEASVRRHVASAIESADWWLFLSLPRPWYQAVEAELDAALDRGVTVRLVVQSPDRAAIENLAYPDDLQVRYRTRADTIVAADRSYGVFRGVGVPSMDRQALATDDDNIVDMLRRYGEQFWLGSPPIQTDYTLPMRFLTPWQALTALSASFEDETTLTATVEGHEVDTGQRDTWTGTIGDYTVDPPGLEGTAILPDIVQFEIETDDGTLTVGGWDATIEDIAAHGFEIDFA
ncbi:TrmB family transcriptional regulator [Halomicroarcula sp. GCM10025709]|uniref:TrmB family transcriptional regulator n=1 Tax=Haloarcula TaxID=2237 RepID=UPI0024C2B044|nr:TrmB family transcriptional regulator sugar-binding domain-containing protein [Halomicroarcula sp. YJ-61-S]